jgi:hypothetical protein
MLVEALSIRDIPTKTAGLGVFPYTKGMLVIITKSIHTSLGLVNNKEGMADVIFDPSSEVIPIVEKVYLVSLLLIAVIVKLEMPHFKLLPGLQTGMVQKSMTLSLEKTQVQQVQVPLTPAYVIMEYRSQGQAGLCLNKEILL